MPQRLTTFLKDRLKAARSVRAAGGAVGPWLVSEVAKGAVAFAGRLEEASTPPTLTAALSTQTRLNFGCGYDKRPGHLNVDSDPQCQPDVLINQHSMSAFPTSFYEAIVAKDVLEHIPRTQSQRVLLQFNDWLREGGTLDLQTSSILGVAEMLKNKRDFEFQYGMTNCLFGTQAHPGDFHLTGFTDVTLKVMLLACGFTFGAFGPLVDGWMFKVEATKARSWFHWNGSEPENAFRAAVFDEALGRQPQPHEVDVFDALVRTRGRRAAALEIFSSYERLRNVAQASGYN